MGDSITDNKANEAKKEPVSGTWAGTETVFMSNNINPFTVMPLAPNQINGQQFSINIQVDSISAYTPSSTIQVKSSMNAVDGSTFQLNGQSIYPYRVYTASGNVQAETIDTGALTGRKFLVSFFGDPQVQMTPGQTVFTYAADPNEYDVIIDGHLTTSNSVGIGLAPINGKALSVSGDVFISGAVSLAGVQLASLGIATSVAPSYVFDVSGKSILNGETTITDNAYITKFLGIGKRSAANALDVSGSSAISNNITVGNTTYTKIVGVGKTANITGGYVADISGNTQIAGKLYVTRTLDVSQNLVVSGTTRILGQGVSPALQVIGDIEYTNNLSGARGFWSDYLNVAGSIAINKLGEPGYNLEVNGDASIVDLTVTNKILIPDGNGKIILEGNAIGTSINTPYIGINIGAYTTVRNPLELVGIAKFGGADPISYSQIGLNVDTPLYEFDMSGTFNTTQTITSNLYVSKLYGTSTGPLGADSSDIILYGSMINDTSLITPKVFINTPVNQNTLSVSGESAFYGNVSITGSLTSYTPIRIIQYNPAGGSGGGYPNAGWWDLSGVNVRLSLDIFPVLYVLDGAGSLTNLTVTIQSDGSTYPRTGLQYSFVARNTTGAGHQIIYPCTNGPTYTRTVQMPLSFPLLCIGTDDYSST
jgi:hypothetical protein